MKSLPSLAILLVAFVWSGLAMAAPVEVIPETLHGAMQPQAAISSNGTIHVTFGKDGTVYCVTSKDGGRSFQPPVAVGTLPKLALGMRRGPRIAVSGNSVVISAISHGTGNLMAWASDDQGATWHPPVKLNTVTNSAREGMHAMAGNGKASVHVAWLDLRSGKTELHGATSRDSGRTWDTNVLIYKSPEGHICECCHPSLAVDGRGRVWAMWRNWLDGSRDMYSSVSDDGGRTFSTARKLGTGTWPLKACPMDGGHLALAPDARLQTVWRRDKSILAADASGERLLSIQGLHPVVGFNRETPLYLWQSGRKLMLKKGSEEPVVLADGGTFASIASSPPGVDPLVVWESSINGAKTILAQRID